tara:strand:- start:388 stop:567 length:180 start_codon:yes stop_codon:yes gene_type:complete
MPTMPDALTEQYPDLPFNVYPVVVWNPHTSEYIYNPSAWPSEGYGTAPTNEQLQEWMNE